MKVDLWLWSLEADTQADRALLSPDERARADRFVKARDAALYIAGRSRLRRILAAETGRAPADLRFDYGAQGKPSLQNGPAFNLSHAGGMAALAVCETGVPGIDIEKIRPVEKEVATRFFSASENAALASLAPDEWLNGFYRCWTRKEAVIKAVGQGLSMPLDSFDVTLAPDVPAALTRIAGGMAKDWHLTALDAGPGFMAALAMQNYGTPVKVRWRTIG
ncbi:4'-phosphopantetheinyl transferase superfamily protein [Sulfitobacter pseudonitzschiae]|uniref:4'-phosphopantetheinyl transferase superfamily protein n=1 Tax=Pseudosulfitobacter pseudonitzschiae TaxID=1402135 RepID=A0A9Q2RXC8_9RHOB|nr:4'-phosphopantetheinyl transferase superfamily protein [Pseudosulfitobacter pseudonitzschiae]MBM2294814.1 4'-phosphopantetheinyl transferase superfamily protein [Pseudosulfitobacter pseudonitzschiae]MBM2299751.1 4'-phosphopantetheinyl transferase superfamily protein [Pseudosulfitobacter pseudonitzschiae]MBM2304651.1 4'-phosphopantetheinyl transferase superfamily protein [Pseudosulfitobacter pseudonitzschiae]MBM2314424.1 4'-phosphopantetheinyl transferase superfamily protein [Pseudosulfitobac